MTSTGIRCSEYQMMIDIEKEFGQACSTSAQCDQVIEVSDSCPTANPVVSISYDAVHLIDMIEEAEMAGCDIDYGSRGDCDSDAEPVCFFGSCTWE